MTARPVGDADKVVSQVLWSQFIARCKLPEQGSWQKKIKKFGDFFVRNVFLGIFWDGLLPIAAPGNKMCSKTYDKT